MVEISVLTSSSHRNNLFLLQLEPYLGGFFFLLWQELANSCEAESKNEKREKVLSALFFLGCDGSQGQAGQSWLCACIPSWDHSKQKSRSAGCMPSSINAFIPSLPPAQIRALLAQGGRLSGHRPATGISTSQTQR